MKAIENEGLVNDLHYGPDSIGFNPVLSFAITNNTTTKTATITDASTFASNDSFKKVLVKVVDTNGKKVNGVIAVAAGNVVISLVGLVTKGISITATVISTKGCKADLGIYDLDGKTGSGSIENVAKQGIRN